MSSENVQVFHDGVFGFDIRGTQFTVHKRLIARNSKALTAMMESGMQESQKGTAPLQETDESTFGRFVEYIYTGDYNAADPVELVKSPEPTSNGASDDEEPREAQDNTNIVPHGPDEIVDMFDEEQPYLEPVPEPAWDFTNVESYGSKRKKARKAKKKMEQASWYEPQILWPEPSALEEPTLPVSGAKLPCPTHDVVIKSALPTSSMFMPDGDWTLDHLPLFLSHARLYVFADTYGIEDLQKLTVRRLDEALDQFQCSSDSATRVADLVEYVYDNTADHGDKVDVLRRVIVNFAANNVHALRNSASFRALLRSGGSFVDHLVQKVCNRFDD